MDNLYPDVFWNKDYFDQKKWWSQFTFIWRAIGLQMKYNKGFHEWIHLY